MAVSPEPGRWQRYVAFRPNVRLHRAANLVVRPAATFQAKASTEPDMKAARA